MKRKLQEFDRQWLRRTKNCTPTQRLEWLTDAQNFVLARRKTLKNK